MNSKIITQVQSIYNTNLFDRYFDDLWDRGSFASHDDSDVVFCEICCDTHINNSECQR